MFKPKGYIAIAAGKTTEDKLMEIALEAGADDIQAGDDVFEVYTTPQTYEPVLAAIKKPPASSPTTPRSASTPTPASTSRARKAQQMLKLIEALEDHDDVQNVWANFEMSDKEMEAGRCGRLARAAARGRRGT